MLDRSPLTHSLTGLAPLGALSPKGDPRLGAHTPQHLVDAFLRDEACGLIVDADGAALSPQMVLDLEDSLSGQGIGPGAVVLVRAQNALSGVAAILAVWRLGATVCPVDPSAEAEVVQTIATEAGARVIVESDNTLHAAPAPATQSSALQNERSVTGDDLGLIIFTSGSSGRPKGVLLSNTNIMTALRAITSYLQITSQDRILCIPPMFLDYGVYQVLFSLFSRCPLVVGTGITNPLRILDMIKAYQPTVIPVVPALASGLTRILNTFGQTIPGVRLVCNTGGHLAPATVDSLRRAFPDVAVVPMYGLTESKRALHLPPEMVDDNPASVGGPMPGLDARVVIEDAAGQLVEAPDNVEGELYVRGSSVMQGYHSAEATGGARLIEGRYREDVWMATGDLFLRAPNGCLYFRGRSKALVKQRGYCLYPRDIEATAEALPGVRSAVMIGRSESDGDETAILFIVAEEGADQATLTKGVTDALHSSLRPRIIHFLPEWPPSPVGKINLNALKDIAKDLT